MRRKISGFLALAMFAVSIPAMAEEVTINLNKVSEHEDADWIYDGNLLIADSDNGYVLMDIYGNPLTDLTLGYSVEYEYGYIVAQALGETINTSGAFAEDGSVVIPFQYGDVKILSKEWAVALSLVEADKDEQYDYESWSDSTYWKIATADVYYLPEQKCVATLERSEYSDADAPGKYINIENRDTGIVSAYDSSFNVVAEELYSVWDDEYADLEYVVFYDSKASSYGVKDADENIIIEPKYDYLTEEDGGYYAVEEKGMWGLLDLEGNEVLPLAYDDVEGGYYGPVTADNDYTNMEAGGYFCVIIDEKMGYVKAGGEVTCEPKYSQDVMENYGASALLTDLEGNVHIIAADGVDTVLEGYDSIYAADYGSGFFYTVYDEEYNSGLIDWHGNVIVPCAYSTVDLSGNGRYVLVGSYGEGYTVYELEYPVDMGFDEEPETEAELETEVETEAELVTEEETSAE